MIKVLVVDDYQEHVDTMVSTLNLYGQDAIGASTGPEALTLIMTHNPNLIIWDGLLRGMRAWQGGMAIQALLATPGTLEVADKPYMVVLTGFASTLQRRLCEEHGFDEYVQKPIELSTLLTWVQKAKQRMENRKDA